MTKSKKYVRRISKKVKRHQRKTQTKRRIRNNRKKTMKGGLQLNGKQVYGTNTRRDMDTLLVDRLNCNDSNWTTSLTCKYIDDRIWEELTDGSKPRHHTLSTEFLDDKLLNNNILKKLNELKQNKYLGKIQYIDELKSIKPNWLILYNKYIEKEKEKEQSNEREISSVDAENIDSVKEKNSEILAPIETEQEIYAAAEAKKQKIKEQINDIANQYKQNHKIYTQLTTEQNQWNNGAFMADDVSNENTQWQTYMYNKHADIEQLILKYSKQLIHLQARHAKLIDKLNTLTGGKKSKKRKNKRTKQRH